MALMRTVTRRLRNIEKRLHWGITYSERRERWYRREDRMKENERKTDTHTYIYTNTKRKREEKESTNGFQWLYYMTLTLNHERTNITRRRIFLALQSLTSAAAWFPCCRPLGPEQATFLIITITKKISSLLFLYFFLISSCCLTRFKKYERHTARKTSLKKIAS